MSDLLVSLYNLPVRNLYDEKMASQGIFIRRPMTYVLSYVREFIVEHFPTSARTWGDQVAATFGRQPVSSFIAVENSKIIGFAALDSTARGFFGPTGVAETHRGKSIGRALLIASLWALRDLGYAYGIVGGAGPVGFYEKVLGSIYVIPDSTPGVYMGGAERLTPPWTPPPIVIADTEEPAAQSSTVCPSFPGVSVPVFPLVRMLSASRPADFR